MQCLVVRARAISAGLDKNNQAWSGDAVFTGILGLGAVLVYSNRAGFTLPSRICAQPEQTIERRQRSESPTF